MIAPAKRRRKGKSAVLANKVQAFYEDVEDVKAPEPKRAVREADHVEAALSGAADCSDVPVGSVNGGSAALAMLRRGARSPATPDFLDALEILDDTMISAPF